MYDELKNPYNEQNDLGLNKFISWKFFWIPKNKHTTVFQRQVNLLWGVLVSSTGKKFLSIARAIDMK